MIENGVPVGLLTDAGYAVPIVMNVAFYLKECAECHIYASRSAARGTEGADDAEGEP
jgi:hypothetical protein